MSTTSIKFLDLKAVDLLVGDVFIDDDTGSFGIVTSVRRIPEDSSVIGFRLPLYAPNEPSDEWVCDPDRCFQVVRS